MPLGRLLREIWLIRLPVAVAAALLLAAGAAPVLLATRQYVASAVVAPAETTGLAASTLIQANVVLQAGGLLDNRPSGNFAVYLTSLRGPEAAAMLARDTGLLRWLGDQRAAGVLGGLRSLLGLRTEADRDDLERWLDRNLAVTQSLATVTVSLDLPHPDREVALDTLRRLHAFAEGKVRDDLAALTARRTAALQERLAAERDLYLRTPLYELLAQHQRAALVMLSDTAVAARVVSAPSVELSPSLPNRPLLLGLVLLLAPLASLLGAACLILLRQPVQEPSPWRTAGLAGGMPGYGEAWRSPER
ncbi:hypothetical protein LPC08_07745 [Roseomonas sp. OT10]|uniref:hypothetical protein n=1 Tax=Roseomonas cutis TaxID=2897332 RepID=UPI001E5FEDA3|nr:hypothetical protein [Roseomonas sp. OT10]UFN50498.1 hypothetical protein LPC08_07745 [Roseomonas sp. OT10]